LSCFDRQRARTGRATTSARHAVITPSARALPRWLARANWAVVPLGQVEGWKSWATVWPSIVRLIFISFHFCLYFQELLQPSKISRKWNATPKNAKSIFNESSRT
jgi:hypothetical protein